MSFKMVFLQVSDLTATNEFLLDQNATLRVSSKRNGTVSMPAVTLSQNNSAAQPQVVLFCYRILNG